MKSIRNYHKESFVQYTDFNIKNFLKQTNKIQIEFMNLTSRWQMAFQT